MRAGIAFLFFVFVILFATGARADDPTAADLKKKGDDAMDALRYDEALAAYTQAYELGHDPAILYNRGRLHQARGEMPAAVDDLERFEREASPDLRAKVPKLSELLAEVRAKVSTLGIHCNVDGARVMVRGVVVGTTPLENVRLNSGAATLEVLAPGYTAYRRDLALAGGGSNVVDVVLVASAAPPSSTPEEQQPEATPITKKWWFWVGAAAIVVAGGITIFALTRPDKSPSDGEQFQPGRVSGPLVTF